MKLFLSIAIIFFFCGCSFIEHTATRAYDNIEIKWKDKNRIDSIRIYPEPFYGIININQLKHGKDYEYHSNGFQIWMLLNGNILRIEAQFDTTIYLGKP